MIIIGHRGAKGLAAENSIDGIRQALKYKVDMIELDVRAQSITPVLAHGPVATDQIYCPLVQALNEVDGQVPINLDIKELKAVKRLPKILNDYSGEILFSSFKFNILQEIKKVFPDSNIAILEKWSSVRVVAEAELLGTKRIHMNEKWMWKKFVQSIKNQGYSLNVYTVDDPTRAKELKSWGVDGIFTDYPDRFVTKK